MNANNRNTRAHDGESIAPVSYTPPSPQRATRTRLRTDWIALGVSLLVLVALAWFVLAAKILEVRVEPADARISVSGGLAVPFGARILLRPGNYTLEASAPGYVGARRELAVDTSAGQRIDIELARLPGRLAVHTAPVTAHVLVDGVATGDSNGEPIPVEAGEHRLRIEAERYLAQEQTLSITGKDELQTLEATLAPGWGTYGIDSQPAGARILVDDADSGTTPAQLELLAGAHHLRLSLDGHRDGVLMIDAVAGEQRTLEPLLLERADARLRITTRPDGASLTLDGVFQGRTPLELAIDSSRAHELIAFKAGYERVVRTLTAGSGSQDITLTLPALSGEVQLAIEPADAEVLLDARALARETRALTLPGVEHTLRVQRSGYQSRELRFTPRPGFAQRIEVKLVPVAAATKPAAAPRSERITTSEGQQLVLLHPQSFTMGSSRREPGRRANEALREMRLQRPFFLGVKEVGNAEFRHFRSAHAAGDFKGHALGDGDLPAVNVSWEDAALYCNWLSEKEKLPPFYRVQNGHVSGFDPASRGYRLPSEAEWAWTASVIGDGSVRRFGWGQELPPPARAGNFADRSGATVLGETIAGYDDGFPVAAPRGSFAPDRHGIFDLDGNAAEWVHDVYEPLPTATASDPLGPQTGELHVIRGASWRHGDLTSLRLAFRDYGKDPRPDLGFRIARYAE